MKDRESDLSLVGQFALSCERMNEFARLLRTFDKFGDVRSGADIRHYVSGWRLEKWVEAEISKGAGLWAVWWLELGEHEKGWIIESHVAVAPDGIHVEYEPRLAASLVELAQLLSRTVEKLALALEQNKLFADEVAKIRQKGGN